MKKIVLTAAATVFLIGAFAFTNSTKEVEKPALINTYTVVTATSVGDLNYKTVTKMTQGYQFQGGVTLSDGTYAQAMVK